jgi:predicted RNA methylase
MDDTMTIAINASSLARLRAFFDERMYALVDFRLSFEAPRGPTGFPKFEPLQSVVARLDASNRTLFRLLRLGQAVESLDVKCAIPGEVLDTFQQTGLLCHTESGQWRSPDLLLVPMEGMLIFVSTPPSYPTASRPADVWFDLSSYVLAKSLRGSFAGARVLDLCSGSGVQTILCAARGAATSLGLDISARAIEIATLNAALNGVGERTAFRRSNCMAALDPDEKFDFIICNTPYAPVLDRTAEPMTLGSIGNAVLLAMIDDIPRCLAEDGCGILATWRSIGRGGGTYQRDYLASRLAAAGLSTLAFVDRAPDTVDGVLRILKADGEERYGPEQGNKLVTQAAALLASARGTVDGFYNQVISFRKREVAMAASDPFGLDISPATASRP